MQVLPDAVIINISPSQKRVLCDPNHSQYTLGMVMDEHSRRPRIPVAEIPNLIERLRKLQSAVSNNPEYSKRRPRQVLAQVILKLEDAKAAQQRAYPKGRNQA